jgi:hypothetical protein
VEKLQIPQRNDAVWCAIRLQTANNVWVSIAVERQAEARFVVRQQRGNPARGRKLLAEMRRRIASRTKI